LHYLSKQYDDLVLLKNFSYKFTKGEKAGIIGNNGSGKTTFLNIITGLEKSDSGKIDHGETVVFGYYKQEGMQFDEGMKVIDVVREIADIVTLSNGKKISVSQFLGYFLFPPEMHNSQVSKLSGGEKRRLYLAVILMKNPNFLILDEPTNDLDIMTLNILEDFLQNYNGCVLAVSHDRYFLDKVADHIFVFEGEGIVKDFPGNYDEYKDYLTKKERSQKKQALHKLSDNKTNTTGKKTTRKFTFKLKHEYQELESELGLLELEKMKIENDILQEKPDQTRLFEQTSKLGELIGLIKLKEERWLELGEMMYEEI